MPRSPRQDHEGAWQHVMNRGIDRQAVFRSYGVQIHPWCLLDNRFHLLL